ncbi:jg20491 [Pararge aegeria aegeria]|uniref:Jg20491 protein n=1 Tax=Pararge aegeria aegeria TaxID=348720 RepID=A0A8S4RTX0_9NEOP|nr:jg20491 [Pararge aegeria aegeria]
MAAAFQQQIFALDARFNAYRAPGNPNFKTLYIRRRSQLLRENSKFKDIEIIKKYINIRSQLLQRRYGVQDNISISSSSSRQRSNSKASLAIEDSISMNAPKKTDNTISENYAFTGVHHIFDQVCGVHQSALGVVYYGLNPFSLRKDFCPSNGPLGIKVGHTLRHLVPKITDREGGLVLKKRFATRHQTELVRSSFCPLMSFRRGVCVVSGSEDSGVYFYDIEGDQQHPVVNKLQGHASTVLGVSFSYDESLLATSDVSGLVIIWRRS